MTVQPKKAHQECQQLGVSDTARGTVPEKKQYPGKVCSDEMDCKQRLLRDRFVKNDIRQNRGSAKRQFGKLAASER